MEGRRKSALRDEVRWSGLSGGFRRSFGKANKAGSVVLTPATLFSGKAAGSFLTIKSLRPQNVQAYGSCDQGARNWTFAEGHTGPGFEEWILVFNPPAALGSGKEMPAKTAPFSNEGHAGTYALPMLLPGQRCPVNINQVAESYGYCGDVSVAAYSEQWPHYAPICERALYFNYKGQANGGSHVFGYQEGETGQ